MKRLIMKNPRQLLLMCMLWMLVIMWFALCVGLSSQTGKETGKLSYSLADFIVETFHLPGTWISELNRVLRRSAHFFCFLVLSILAGTACVVTFQKSALAFIWPVFICVPFAFIDEIRKAGIPGRHCSILEAWINVGGCISGTVLLGLVLWSICRKN